MRGPEKKSETILNIIQELPATYRNKEEGDDEIGTKDKVALFGCEDGSLHCVAIYSRKIIFTYCCTSAINTLTFLKDSHFVIGCQSGEILLLNIENTNNPVKLWFESNSAVLCVASYKGEGFISSHADGHVVYRHLMHDDKRVVLTGSDWDPVYEVCVDQHFVYTCCRDAQIRRYNVQRVIGNLLSVE